MDIKDFEEKLRSPGVRPGATWQKADFHVHAPSSSDYMYRSPDASALLGQALQHGDYRFAVILKHNEFPTRDDISAIQPFCPATSLIPGAEVNVAVDALFKKIGKDLFFHCIIAVDPDNEGDYGYVLRKAQESLSYQTGDGVSGFRSSVLDVGKFFRNDGALFIPAHLHQASHPETSRSIDDLYDDEAFLGFVRDGAFDSLEVRSANTAHFFNGTTIASGGLPIPACICVASSDAHHHNHISARHRCTWLHVEQASFAEVTAALSFPHRASLDQRVTGHPRIFGIHIIGSFIREAWITLNSGLTALIGCKGSGKTALLECIRFVLNTPIPPDRRESVNRHVAHVLGSSGYVECLVERQDGSRALIVRRADSPDRIAVTDSNGDTSVIPASGAQPFPVSILGWHEIEAVADKAEARIALLDRSGDAVSVRALYEQIHNDVERARDTLPVLQRQVKNLDAALKDLWDLQRKRSALKRLEQKDLLALQEQYEWYLLTEQRLAALRSAITQRSPQVPDTVTSHLVLPIVPAPHVEESSLASAALKRIADLIQANEDVETRSVAALTKALMDVDAVAADAAKEVASAFVSFRQSVYAPKVAELPPEDREVLTKQIQVLEETKRLPLVQNQCEDMLRDVTVTAGELRDIYDKICHTRERIAGTRRDLVEVLNGELLGNIKLRFLRSADKAPRQRFKDRYGPDGAMIVGYVERFGREEAYENLRELFRELASLTLEQDKWKVQTILWDTRLVELLEVLDEDDVEISLPVGKAGLTPLQNLSAGQRCVAVFPLLLRNTRGPLVIDQPEDNLDNRYIADTIAPDLLRRKQNQQFVVTSHNANLVVLTDADLVVHMDSDGATCHVSEAGFLSCAKSRVRQSVLDVLDGGEAALAARQRKYGTRG